MRFPFIALALILLVLIVACTEGGFAEPIGLPAQLPTVTPLPTASPLPEAADLPIATKLPAATELPTATAEATATELPTVTPLPTVVPLPEPTELPTAEPAPPAPVLPVAEPTPEMSLPQVTIGAATWPVELAITPAERVQGLSGREVLPEGTGMLFIFEDDQPLTFWMPDMNFPLDMVWIDSGCQVVDATINAPVPEPGQGPLDLPRFSPKSPARFVLEINAGEFEGAGLSAGERAVLGGALEGQYGC